MIVSRLTHLFAITILLVAAWFAYRPGLNGGFLFDDFANLPSLGDMGRIDNGAALARYVTSGTADPLGRPIAVASFLVDAKDWPASPYPFKRTNVLLHLLNGLLLYLTLIAIGRQGLPGISHGRVASTAWITTALWTLHPLFVSTTLYIVQREAMLPATFTLLGILAWMKTRERLHEDKNLAAIGYAAVSLGLCTALATLSKANGILLPALILSMEYTVLSVSAHDFSRKAHRLHHSLLLASWILTGIVGIALVYVAMSSMINGLPHRPWTESQRLLTEPRILWQYLGQLWMPHPYTAGVFNDAVTVSVDALHPWTTIPSILALFAALAGAILWRKRWPVIACAVLFFFAGHLLESTSVPLELYFEHRNYLPAMLLFWPLGVWLTGADRRPGEVTKSFPPPPVRYAIATLVIVSLGAMTRANANVWGDTDHQASLWAMFNPKSPRAQVGAAQEELRHGAADKAVARLTSLLQERPTEVQIAFNLIAAHCALGDLSPAHLNAARRAISTAIDPGTLILSWFDRTIPAAKNGDCPHLDLHAVTMLAQAGLGNPHLPAGRHQDLEHVLGTIALTMNRPDEALMHFNRALALDPREPAALMQAAELGSAGHPRQGLSHLAFFDKLRAAPQEATVGMPAIHAWVLRRQQYWPRERARLEATLRADVASPQ